MVLTIAAALLIAYIALPLAIAAGSVAWLVVCSYPRTIIAVLAWIASVATIAAVLGSRH